ncbi:MAG: iron ABC transporter permease [Chloroflexi bacterium]|nr:iron ABC transporter permease [Chloroflexota bacterium]
MEGEPLHNPPTVAPAEGFDTLTKVRLSLWRSLDEVAPGKESPPPPGASLTATRALLQRATGRPRRGAGPILVAAGTAIILFCLVPTFYIFVRAARSWDTAIATMTSGSAMQAGLNTVMLAGTVTVASALIALPLAWLVERTDIRGRRIIGILGALPLAIPSYVGAMAFIAAFGPRGLVQSWLEPLGVERLPSIYGFTGAAIVMTLFTYPYLYLTLRPALAAADPRIEELSRTFGFGRWVTFRRVVLPGLRPALASGGLLVALYVLSDFGAPTLLRFSSFTRVIYVRYTSTFDRSTAAALAILLMALALAVVALEVWVRSRRRLDAIRDAGRPPPRVSLGRWRWPAYLFVAVLFTLALVLPIGVLVYWLLLGLQSGVAFRGITGLMTDSVTASALAAIVAVIVASPVAMLSVRHLGWFSRTVEIASYTGYALPGLVVALAFVFASVRVSWLYQTLPLLVLAYVLLFLPQATSAMRVSLERIRPSMEEAARGLGQPPWRVLATITVPLAGRGMLAGAALVFLTTIKELPATLILSPAGFHTLALRVWNSSTEARYGEAAGPALILVGISALALIVFRLGTDARPIRADVTPLPSSAPVAVQAPAAGRGNEDQTT